MDRFSEELYELDRNTEQFMVDDMTKKIAKLEQELSQIEEIIAERDNEISVKDNELAANAETIARLQARIKELERK